MDWETIRGRPGEVQRFDVFASYIVSMPRLMHLGDPKRLRDARRRLICGGEGKGYVLTATGIPGWSQMPRGHNGGSRGGEGPRGFAVQS
jgi:hypothetical protein